MNELKIVKRANRISPLRIGNQRPCYKPRLFTIQR
jgi:hypothetical protein